MRWFSFLILAYVALGIQTGLAKAIAWNNAAPNFGLLAVVFISLYAPYQPALLGAFALGLMQDLTTQGTVGIYAFGYGFVALFIVSVQRVVYREHPLTHVALVLAAGMICVAILGLHEWWRPAAIPRPSTAPLVFTALYSAALAPIVLGLLQRIGWIFHFSTLRPATGER